MSYLVGALRQGINIGWENRQEQLHPPQGGSSVMTSTLFKEKSL